MASVGVPASDCFLLYNLLKEVYCYLLGVAEEFRSILEKKVANLFLVLFVVLRYVFRVYLVAVDSCN